MLYSEYCVFIPLLFVFMLCLFILLIQGNLHDRAVISSQKLAWYYCFTSVDKESNKTNAPLWKCHWWLCYLCFVFLTVWCRVKRWTVLRGLGRFPCRPLIFWINWWEGHLDTTPESDQTLKVANYLPYVFVCI